MPKKFFRQNFYARFRVNRNLLSMYSILYLHNWEPRKFTPSGVCFERHLIMYLPRLMHGNGPKQQQWRRQQLCLREKTSTYIIAEKRTNPPWRRWLKLCSISIVLERINENRVSDCMYQYSGKMGSKAIWTGLFFLPVLPEFSKFDTQQNFAKLWNMPKIVCQTF